MTVDVCIIVRLVFMSYSVMVCGLVLMFVVCVMVLLAIGHAAFNYLHILIF